MLGPCRPGVGSLVSPPELGPIKHGPGTIAGSQFYDLVTATIFIFGQHKYLMVHLFWRYLPLENSRAVQGRVNLCPDWPPPFF